MTAALRRIWAALRELTGEADYDRYVRRHRGGAVLTPGEYWQQRWRHDEQPGTRCC
jgi:uncharacterized short protein YbdD (DUF466 family)